MLDRLFISVLNMSLVGSVAIVLVLIARLLLKKAPKLFSYALWGIVLFRLLCPFSFESAISLMPMGKAPIPQDIIYSAAPQINTGVDIIDNSINPLIPAPNMGDSANPIQIWLFIAAIIWTLGMIAMLFYSIAAFARLKRRLIGAIHLQGNIYLADHISSPFVMGLFKPKIYLPSSLSDAEKDFIIAHEMCHIKRLDHVTRVLGFAALTVHWFNPLAWIAFVVSGKDMELSCDEAVMTKMDTDIRAEYSQSLLRFGAAKGMIQATPLAFGEGDTKSRVKNVLNYKKPAFWVTVVAIVAVTAVGVGLLANPKPTKPPTLYAYSHNGVIPMNLGTYSWNGMMSDFISYTEMDYDKAISYNDGGRRNANIFFSTSDTPSSFNTDNAKGAGQFEIVEMKRYINGKEEILEGFKGNMIEVSLETDASYLYEFKVQFGANYGYYSIKINNNVAGGAVLEPLSHDQAVTSALISLGSNYLEGECLAEGHIILGYDDSDKDKTKIYALTQIGGYGFENDNFVNVSGSAFPAVITLNSDNTVSIEQPTDGSDYTKSIEKMFPKEYHDRIFGTKDTDRENLRQQGEKYASEYLAKIGRAATIGDRSDFDYPSPTDLGVSVDAANNLEIFYKEHNYYPSFLGTRERLESGVRTIYETSYHENQDEIRFTKYDYDTKKILEQFIANSNTGNIVR